MKINDLAEERDYVQILRQRKGAGHDDTALAAHQKRTGEKPAMCRS